MLKNLWFAGIACFILIFLNDSIKNNLRCQTVQEGSMTSREQILDGIVITKGPKYHFFGYYDKHQFNENDRYVLGLEVDFMDRSPQVGDVASIGIIDLKNNYQWTKIAETTAWCWQQGCMLQWLPSDPAHKIIYNAREGEKYVSYIQDAFTGEKEMLPMAIYAVSPDGKYAVCVDFARLGEMRPGYGYNGIPDLNRDIKAPANSGIWVMDLETKETKLIVTLDQVAKFKPAPRTVDARHRCYHLLFNKNSNRFIFLNRWLGDKGGGTRMFTAKPDGSDLRLIRDFDIVSSHFEWRNAHQIIVWGGVPGRKGNWYVLHDEPTGKMETIGEGVLTGDGHMQYNPDGRWILTDTYPDKENTVHLMLIDCIKNERIIFAHLRQSIKLGGEMRCDSHPRFSRDGKFVTVDHVAEDGRQIVMFDVRPIVGY